MAINKKLIHFKKHSDFISNKGTNGATSPNTNGNYGQIPANSIVFILDTKQIWTHGQYYNCPYTQDEITALLNNKADISDLNNYLTTKAAESLATKTELTLGISAKYTKPSTGIPKDHLASAVLTSLGKADTALLSIPSEYITETELAAKGYTTNIGTITGIKMNGASKGSSGVVDLGTVITSHQDISGKAPIASPTFTGTPKAPTATKGTNTTQVATTAFVQEALPTALPNPKTLTIQKNGTNIATYNGSSDVTANITVPTNLASLTNDLKSLKVGSKSYNGSAEITITAADLGLSSALKYHGTTTTALTDGATTKPIVIGGSNHNQEQGCVVAYGKKEFVWTGSAWEELGNEGNYKVVQSAVSSPSTSGNATAFIDTISLDANGKITATKKNVQFPTALKNPNVLKFGTKSYDGSSELTITAADLGALTLHLSLASYATLNWVSSNFNNYVLPKAASTTLGGIKTGYNESGKNYKVLVDTNGNAYVTVPWSWRGITDSVSTSSSNISASATAVKSAYDLANSKWTYNANTIKAIKVNTAGTADIANSVNWTNVNNKPTNLSQFNDDVVVGNYMPLSGGTLTGEIKFNIADLIYKDISAGIIAAFKAPRVQINELISNYIYLGSASQGYSSDSSLVIRKYSSITDKSPSGTTDLVTIDTSGNVTAIGGFTGNLTGTATKATTADSATYAESAGNTNSLGGSNAYRYMVAVSKETANINSAMGYTDNRPFIARLAGVNQEGYPAGDGGYGNLVHFSVPGKDTAFQLYSAFSAHRLLYRMGTWKADGSGTVHKNAWKTVAFTDSDITGNAATATNAAAVNGVKIAIVSKIPSSPDSSTLYFVK